MDTVIGLFPDFHTAREAVDALGDHGFGDNEVGLVARNRAVPGHEGHRNDLTPAAIAVESDPRIEGAVEGAAIGSLAGLALAVAALVLPGLGPVFVAGALGSLIASTGAGAAAGAVTGGLLGTLADLGVADEHAEVYAEGVKRGGVLVTVHASDERGPEARRLLYEHGAVDVEDHRDRWAEAGWDRFDTANPPGEDYPRL